MSPAFLQHTDFVQKPGVHHAFFTKQLAPSSHSYFMRFEHDTPESVEQNHKTALRHLDTPFPAISVMRQVHRADVHVIDSVEKACTLPECDSQVTNIPRIPLGVLTADCSPVLFADDVSHVIGAAHAGWKGAKAGIIENTITAMEALGAKRERIEAAIGPTIHQQSYEVGPEFLEEFLNDSKDYAVFFSPPKENGHVMFDLPGFVEHQLAKSGVNLIHNLGMDTLSNEDLFFSYRRNCLRNETYCRNLLSVIMLTSDHS